MKILIIRFSSIGDIVLTTPVVRVLKTQLDGAEIHYATKKQFSSLFQENPYIDKMHYLQGSLIDFVRILRQEKFDYIIDLHNNLRTTLIKLMLGVTAYKYDKLNFRKWLMVNLKINKLPQVHIVERYLATVRSLGIKNDSLGLDYFIPEKDEIPADWLPATHQSGYVVYAIGGQHATKKLPVKRMIELCGKIKKPVILLGGKEDIQAGEEVRTFFDQQNSEGNTATVIYNACGKCNLNQSASLVRNASLVFTHDTGLMHIAAAFKKEVVSIWGNTIPDFGMYPYRTRFTTLENNHVSCRPCSKIGYAKCPKGHFNCMNKIDFDFQIP